MAYLPPHKRHSNAPPKPSPPPQSLIPQFNQALTLTSNSKRKQRNRGPQDRKIFYAANSISRWVIAGGSEADSVRLEPFDCEVLERKHGMKPVVVRGGRDGRETEDEGKKIADRVGNELIESWKSLEWVEGSKSADGELMVMSKLSFVARLGKVLILGNAVDLEAVRRAADAEADSRKEVTKLFYNNISDTYIDDLQHVVVPNIGFEFHSEKEHYHVKVFDKSRPDSTISCKCTVVNGGRALEIYKIELNPVRHLVVDISCLYKDQDLRFMLSTKRIMKTMDDEENDGMTKLVKSAVIDPDVKGGLRWPLGKETVGDRFSIVGVWHTKYKSFKSKTMRIKLRHADRFDHMASIGEDTTELTLRLTGISKHLRDTNTEKDVIKEMVQEEVKFIWDQFLSYKHPSA